jgi:Lrp/AsnC family transcriptional regulator, leucine-responsive regulatory protein
MTKALIYPKQISIWLRLYSYILNIWHSHLLGDIIEACDANTTNILSTTMENLDEIDRSILRILQQDGRIQNVELAGKVGLSPSPCLRRVRILEEAGVIERYAAQLNAAKIGVGLTVFVRIWLKSQDASTVDHFTREVQRLPEVMECHLMAGDCDFLLRVVAPDLDTYRRLQIDHLTRIKGVQSLKTEIPIQQVKLTSALPV